MTVCIAAIAAGGRAIVLLADSAVSFLRDGQTVLKADNAVRKIRELADSWVGLISGPLDFGEQVLFNAQIAYRAAESRELAERLPMPECVKSAYQIARGAAVIDNILSPRLLDEAWYKRKVARQVSERDQFFIEISRLMDEYSNQSTLLVCGFEPQGPELYLVTNPGILKSVSVEGFGVIGIGEDTARNRLYALGVRADDGLTNALYNLYDAKESCAEFLPDVGHEWDAVVAASGKLPVRVPNDIKEVIECLHQSHPRSPFDHRKPPPVDWRVRLEKFELEVLGDAGLNQHCIP